MKTAHSTTLLSVEHLTIKFGGLIAIKDLSFTANSHEITSIIGPNGAGKTTAFNCITGFYKPSSGQLILSYEDSNSKASSSNKELKNFNLEEMKDIDIARKAKIARTFQNIRLFSGLTLLENLIVAQHNELMRASFFSLKGIFGFKSYRIKEKEAVEKAKYWLKKIGLLYLADNAAGSLSYGNQRKLEIARSMCTDPILLCLDEPAAGLNPKESQELTNFILSLKEEHKTSIILIEHDMRVVMQISDHVVVLNHGEKIAEGTTEKIKNDPKVIAAYLGDELNKKDEVKQSS